MRQMCEAKETLPLPEKGQIRIARIAQYRMPFPGAKRMDKATN